MVSVNYYARWQPEPGFMADLAVWCGDKPFIVTEFYVKGADANYKGRAYTNTDGGGWLVRTQRNRGEFYQNFCLRLLETRNCAGWMHFEYNDGYGGTTDSNQGSRIGGVHPLRRLPEPGPGAPHEPLPAGLLLRHGALIPVPSANACAGRNPATRHAGFRLA